MKKKIVYLLCELKLIKLAEKISPSIVCCWRGEKVAQGMREAFERMSNTILSASIGLQEFAKQLKEYKTDSKAEHSHNSHL